MRGVFQAAVAGLLQSAVSSAQTTAAAAPGSCPTVLRPSYNSPVVGGGWVAQLIVTGLKSPRGILFDQNGALLVVQQGTGIQHVTFKDNGGTCLIVDKSQTLINLSDVSPRLHGVGLF